ncbi:MAG TPA: GntR family transcriptional regulator [Terriglobia bacterium]|nr:GntR family transcriptional regulator [Terriglobia bacterium]
MKLWLSRNSVIPIQRQLKTQLMLGIASGDYAPGARLPSTSEIARRFHIHANTVRAVYRGLVRERWAEWRRGSGFYVRRRRPAERIDGEDLDNLVSGFMEMALGSGFSIEDIRASILRWTAPQSPDHILVIEPDAELRAILVAEISEATGAPVDSGGIEVARVLDDRTARVLVVALPGQAEAVRAALPAGATLLALRPRSVAGSMTGRARPSDDTPITVISRWPDFLRWAEAVLTGAGLDPAAFDLRDARQKGWDRGLTARTFIVTETLTATRLPAPCRPIVFAVISDEAMSELQRRVATEDTKKDKIDDA